MSQIYSVKISPGSWGKYSVDALKKYGNYYGHRRCEDSKEDVLSLLKHMFEEWEKYDSILGRDPDKITDANLEFLDTTGDFCKQELLGNSTLAAWF